MIPATTSSGVIEGAHLVQRIREQIATERPGAPPGSAVKECDDNRREDE